jgi:predicted RNase H-like nuclease (RuvC/YqgF family)
MSRQTKGRRRLPAMTRRALRHANRDLRHQLDGAGHLIEGLRLQVEELGAKAARRDEADRARHAQKKADAIDVGSLQQQLKETDDAYEQLLAEHRAVKADLENATAIDVPPMERDTDGLDQITEPIYAALWQQQFAEQEQATPEVKTLTDALGGAR